MAEPALLCAGALGANHNVTPTILESPDPLTTVVPRSVSRSHFQFPFPTACHRACRAISSSEFVPHWLGAWTMSFALLPMPVGVGPKRPNHPAMSCATYLGLAVSPLLPEQLMHLHWNQSQSSLKTSNNFSWVPNKVLRHTGTTTLIK